MQDEVSNFLHCTTQDVKMQVLFAIPANIFVYETNRTGNGIRL